MLRLKIITLILLLVCGCSLQEKTALQPADPSLQVILQYRLDVPEPSGLSLGQDNQSLWTVSDPPSNQIYQIDLSGNVMRTLSYRGDDLEGVVYDAEENVLWVAEERKRELVKISLDGRELERHSIDVPGNDANGLEGICLAPEREFWVVHEKNPGQLIELNTDFTIRKKYELNIAADYSGVCSDTAAGRFWVVSDESRLLFLWDKETGLIEKYSLPMDKAEGVAVDFESNQIYIVSDSQQKLYILKLKN